MPRRCVAALCNKADSQLYVWPKDENLARIWTRFVRTKRDKWKPSATSVLCSDHFTEECFSNLRQFKAGLSKKLLLDRSKSVPTIHAHPPMPMVLPIDETPRSAVRKRQSARICSEYENQETADVSSEAEEPQSYEDTTDSKPAMITRGTQTRKFKPEFKRPPHRSRGIQTCLEEVVEPSIPVTTPCVCSETIRVQVEPDGMSYQFSV